MSKKRIQSMEFGLCVVGMMLLLLVVPTLVMAQKDQWIGRIQGYAQKHVSNGEPMQTELVVEENKDNNAGLLPEDIAKIYEEEYVRFSALMTSPPPTPEATLEPTVAISQSPPSTTQSSSSLLLWLGIFLVAVLIVGGYIWRNRGAA